MAIRRMSNPFRQRSDRFSSLKAALRMLKMYTQNITHHRLIKIERHIINDNIISYLVTSLLRVTRKKTRCCALQKRLKYYIIYLVWYILLCCVVLSGPLHIIEESKP